MNNAPVSSEHIYDWLCNEISKDLKELNSDIDFDELETIEKVYSVELRRLKKSALKLLPSDSIEYKTRLADEIIRLQNDCKLTTQALVRFCGAERNKLTIIVLDNCDKRLRNEQLLMFQAAQWLQREFRALIILPLREETYDNHRNEPPLDTALKDMAFRIEPPSFHNVLTKRVNLALAEMKKRTNDTGNLEYVLPNGMKVQYPASEQAYYLSTILKSVFEYDRFIRRMIVGLAGRDLRRAMEIFLEFCTSGHIGEDEIFKITQAEGRHVLPYHVVTRVLFRMNRRYYDGDSSYVKNVFLCHPEDPKPSYFTRLSILNWCDKRFHMKGPTNLKGYHQVHSLKTDLFPLGLTDEMVQRELLYLLKAKCIFAEHFRVDQISNDDLIKLAPAGSVHLDLIRNPDYLAAIAEETWFDNEEIASLIMEQIVEKGTHYGLEATLKNAETLVKYLQHQIDLPFPNPTIYLDGSDWDYLIDISNSVRILDNRIRNFTKQNPWFNVGNRYKVNQIVVGSVDGIDDNYGIFVQIEPDVIGLVHISNLPPMEQVRNSIKLKQQLTVRINSINETSHRMALELID